MIILVRVVWSNRKVLTPHIMFFDRLRWWAVNPKASKRSAFVSSWPLVWFWFWPSVFVQCRVSITQVQSEIKFIIFSFYVFTFKFIAGTCWLHRMDGGSCKQPQRRFVSRTECCSRAGGSFGFTEPDMDDREWFMSVAIGDGTTCSSCLGNI